jgi:hypothetical protein
MGESPDKANRGFIIIKAGRSEQVQLGHRRPPQPAEVGWDDLSGGADDTKPEVSEQQSEAKRSVWEDFCTRVCKHSLG